MFRTTFLVLIYCAVSIPAVELTSGSFESRLSITGGYIPMTSTFIGPGISIRTDHPTTSTGCPSSGTICRVDFNRTISQNFGNATVVYEGKTYQFINSNGFQGNTTNGLTLNLVFSAPIQEVPLKTTTGAGTTQTSASARAAFTMRGAATLVVGGQTIFSELPLSGSGIASFAWNELDARVVVQTSISQTYEFTRPSHFVPTTPCRTLDTRQTSALTANTARAFTITNCGVPAEATALALNITAVPSGPLGYLTVWPTNQEQPAVSTLNSLDGRIKANAAIVGLSSTRSISMYATDATNVVVDVNGYFVPAGTAGALAFYPTPPCRVVDTRLTGGVIPAQGTRKIDGSGGCLPAQAQAYSLNVTAVPPGPLGYLTLYPDGTERPETSTLNALTGTVVANGAILKSGTGGAFQAFVTDRSHAVIDLNGYFAPPGQPGALAFYPLPPCRMLDTRNAAGPFGGPAMVRDASREFTVPSSGCGVPTTAQAYAVNATVVPQGIFGYLTLYPGGTARPSVSTLNAVDGALNSNGAIVTAGAGGLIGAYTSDAGHLLLDISGYFAPDTTNAPR